MKIGFFKRIPVSAPKQEASPLQRAPLTSLPLGEITCREGWLFEQMKRMAEGITGKLPLYGPYFKPDRNGFLYADTPSGWEEVPLWLRGFYPLAVLLDDPAMLRTAEEYIEAIFRSRKGNGWFGPAYLECTRRTEEGWPIPDLFPIMILSDTLILYHEHTGDARVLSLFGGLVRYCLALREEQFLPPIDDGKLRWQCIRGGDMLEELYWYYRQTGDGDALTLAERVHRSIAKSTSGYVATHAVDFSQRFAYDAIYSQQSGKEEDFLRSEAEYQKFASVWGQMPKGIFAADEQIREGATDPREAFEPCGMVELAKNFYVLGRISGLPEYAQRAEDVMLNHFPAAFTPDYRQIQYLTSANSPIRSNETYAATYNGSMSHDRSYQLMTPNNRCCGHNTGMGWPYYVKNLWQRVTDGGLAACLYAPCEIRTEADGKPLFLRVRTDYPFREEIFLDVEFDGVLPLYLRLPKWCEHCLCTVNGKTVWDDAKGDGWLLVEREWKKGDTLALHFSAGISLTHWKNGSVSVNRGPLTYSVRIKEEYRVPEDSLAYRHPEPHLWENYEILPASPWNYGIYLDRRTNGTEIRLHSVADTLAPQPFCEENAPIVLRAEAKRIPEWKLQDSCAAELQKGPIYSEEPTETVELIPMGCARLRMTCLPLVTDDPEDARWVEVPAHIPPKERPRPFSSHYDLIQPGEKKKASQEAEKPWKPDDE